MAYAVAQQYTRYRVSLPVDVVAPDGSVHELNLDDISLGGVFVRTRRPASPGSFVRLRLPLGGRSVPVVGRVVHALDDDAAHAKGRPAGMGIQFDGLAPDAEDGVRRFIDALADAERRSHDVERVRAPLADVLAAADHLADRIAHLDGFAAVGLSPGARPDEIVATTSRLLRLFTGAYAHARPSERRRIERAARALRALEERLLARPSPVDFA
jgi:hypothetical protein